MVLVVLHNFILITLMIWRWRCHKPSVNFYPGHHNEVKDYYFDRFADILLTFTGFLHIPEHIYLIVYLYRFIGIYIKWDDGYRKEIWRKMKEFPCSKKKNAPCVLLNGIVLMLMLLVVFALPSMSIAKLHIHSNSTEEYCSKKLAFVQNSLMHASHGVSFFTNTVVALTRFLMVFFTVMIGVMWRRVHMELCKADYNRQKNRCSRVESVPLLHESSKHEANLECETTFQQHQDPGHKGDSEEPGHNGDKTNSQDIERDTNPQDHTHNSDEANSEETGLSREDTNLHKSGHKANNQDPRAPLKLGDWEDVCCRHTDCIIEYTTIKDNVFPIYKIFQSFFVLQWIIHLAGLFCHIAYLLRPWVRNGSVANSTMQYSLTHLFLIKVESVSKSSFLPRIPGTGLSISVESPGFVLSIVFSVFALIGTLISF